MKPYALIPVLMLSSACSEFVDDAGGVELLVPDEVVVPWDDSFNAEDDGLGAFVPVDLMVYEATTGEPLDMVELSVDAGSAEVLLTEQLFAAENLSCDDCGVWWDAVRDRYVEIDGDEAVRPRVVQTDDAGLARVYIFVDSVDVGEVEGADFASLPVVVSMGDREDTFLLSPR